ncbi:MAG: hypothetical protein KAU17_05460 [Spirochaetales bacterium]|nr:hypothetical protein [Spirochaetales bacterium]
MKKIIGLALLLLFIGGMALYADESDLYVKTVQISRIYTLRDGYRIIYMKSNNTFSVTYFPIEWFRTSGGKGEIVYGRDDCFPYFSVFWENGTFHHIRLYVHSDPNHQSWGVMPTGFDSTGKFDVEAPVLEF